MTLAPTMAEARCERRQRGMEGLVWEVPATFR
jgi:hypothetical protein